MDRTQPQREAVVKQVHEALGGGTFLFRAFDPNEIFTREDLSNEQRLFGQTAAEFMRNEVLPNESRLYAHDWGPWSTRTVA